MHATLQSIEEYIAFAFLIKIFNHLRFIFIIIPKKITSSKNQFQLNKLENCKQVIS